MKKRVLSLFLAFALCLGLSAMAGAEGTAEGTAENVAEVTIGNTTTPYTNIVTAFTDAQEAASAAVKLLDTVTIPQNESDLSYGIKLQSGNITLDLNGHTIQTTEGASTFYQYSAVFYIGGSKSSSSSLTVLNSTGDGKIVQPNGGQAIHVGYNGTLTVESGTIEVTSDKGDSTSNVVTTQNCAVLVRSGTADIRGGMLTGNKGIYIGSGALTVSGGTIHGKSSYALQVAGGTASLTGGTYTTDVENGCSIWNADGTAADLLANGYRYQDANGTASTYSTDTHGVVGNTTVAERPADEFPYIGADGKPKAQGNCTLLTADGFEDVVADGTAWFAADTSFIADNPLRVLGTVNLILCDDVTVTLNKGIYLENEGTLNIYAQSGGTGKLVLTGSNMYGANAGIYISTGTACKTALNIYGGNITATGSSVEGALGSSDLCGAGIGTSANYNYESTMTVTISGGTVTAKSGGEGAAAIGNGTGANAKGTVKVTIADGMKRVKTDDLNTPCEYGNTDGTSVTVTKCEAHAWEYTYTEDTHTQTCKLCRFDGGTEAHSVSTWTFKDESQHTGYCVCGKKMGTADHSVQYTPNADGLTHTISCKYCDLTPVDQKHNFQNGDCVCGIGKSAEYDGQQYASLQAAINAAAKNNGTVTLAQDVSENVTVTSGTVTVDMDGKTWHVYHDDQDSSIIQIPLTVTGGSVTLKNGTISQELPTDGKCGIRITGGSVTVEGTAVVIGSNKDNDAELLPAPAIELTSGELTSGSLTLKPGATLVYGLKVPEGKTLSEYLPAGTAFGLRSYDENAKTWTVDKGLFAGAYTKNKYAEHDMALVVVKHTHGFAAGSSTCACGYVCEHPGMNSETGECTACGMPMAVASVTAAGETPTVSYYREIGAAFNAAKTSGGGTLTLLQDVALTDETNINIAASVGVEEYNFTVDWNGKTLSGNYSGNLLILSDRVNVTLKDSSGNNAGGVRNKYTMSSYFGEHIGGTAVCVSPLSGYSVTIEGGTYSARVLKREDVGDLQISGGVFENPAKSNASPAIAAYDRNDKDVGALADLLVDGYTFAYDKDGTNLLDVYSTAHTDEGRTVYVVPHTHSNFNSDNKCACGYTCPHAEINDDGTCKLCGKEMVASVTVGANVTYYDTLGNALNYAKQNNGYMLKLLADVTGTTVQINDPFIFDLNGHSVDALSVNAKATIKDSGTKKGKIGTLNIYKKDADPEANAPTIVLGDLLTGGDSLNADGKWLTAEQLLGTTASDVSVVKTEITGVTLNTPQNAVYGETGTFAASLKLDVTPKNIETLTHSWFELTGGKWEQIPNSGASEGYHPANLNAGSHTIRGAVMAKGGCVLSNAVTVEVAKASIAEATVTLDYSAFVYDGTAKTPSVTDVELNAKKLTAGTDYDVTVESKTNAGSDYTVTVTGKGNYTGSKTAEWTIEPHKVEVAIDKAVRTYNGTDLLPVSGFSFKSLVGGYNNLLNKELTNGGYEIVNAHYDSAGVGDAKTIFFTVKLLNENYAFEDGLRTKDFEMSGSNYRIEKAVLSSESVTAREVLTIVNKLSKTYEIDLAQYLPKLTVSGCEYGSVSYDQLSVYLPGYYGNGAPGTTLAEIKDGKVLLPILPNGETTTGEVGEVQVTVISANYKDFVLIIKVNAISKIEPAGQPTLSKDTLIYGEKLGSITLSGAMKDPNDGSEVTGTFEWFNPEEIPAVSDDYWADWKFIPDDAEKYLEINDSVRITLKKATPTGEPKYTLITSSGKTLADAALTGTFSVAGTLQWVDKDGNALSVNTEVKANTAYKWVFISKDGNYEAEGVVTLWQRSSGSSSSGGSTTTKTETTKNSDGSTTKTETKSDGTVIETTKNPDGSTSKTESKTTTKSNGTTVETVTETNTGVDGSKSTSKTETTTAKDGSKTETKTETKTEADGTKSETKSETKTDANGVTNGKETTKTTAPNGSTGTTITTTENGNSKTEAETKISNKAVEDAKKSGEAVKIPTEVKTGEDSNSAPTVKVELPKNAGETKIEIPVSDVNSGTVAVIVHPDGTEEIVKDSKPTEDGVQLTVDGSATVKIIDNSKDFRDTRDHWSRDEVNFVTSREIFNGVGGNNFGVNQPMTRGMVNTVLARLAGVDTTPSAGQKWYEVGTAWAKANGISDGTNPEASVTRQQLATLLYRFCGTPEVNGSLQFSDAHEISAYAQDALLWATQNGILNGVGKNCVAPGADAQRAQVAAMMARYLKSVG